MIKRLSAASYNFLPRIKALLFTAYQTFYNKLHVLSWHQSFQPRILSLVVLPRMKDFFVMTVVSQCTLGFKVVLKHVKINLESVNLSHKA